MFRSVIQQFYQQAGARLDDEQLNAITKDVTGIIMARLLLDAKKRASSEAWEQINNLISAKQSGELLPSIASVYKSQEEFAAAMKEAAVPVLQDYAKGLGIDIAGS